MANTVILDVDGTPITPNTTYGQRIISEKIQQKIDEYIVSKFSEPFRTHLGASIIGHKCAFYLWAHFRWIFRDIAIDKKLGDAARQQRLFNRGHREETWVRHLMRAAGATFLDTVDVDGKQISVRSLDKHFGGSCDGVFIWPECGLTLPTLLEIKTSGTGAKFNDLKKKFMRQAKFQHFAQQSVYGRLLGIEFALYVAVNKNDDDWHIEIAELDWSVADGEIKKADYIINLRTPPERLSDNPDFTDCKYCSANVQCHFGKNVEVNCRSCAKCVAAADGIWYCEQYQQNIPKDFIPKGCTEYVQIKLK
jgi:hypothetical protein